MAEQLSPQEWAKIMKEAFKNQTEPVHRYEGTGARLIGDSILASFGAPETHEDNPQRAALCRLTILDHIEESAQKKESLELPMVRSIMEQRS